MIHRFIVFTANRKALPRPIEGQASLIYHTTISHDKGKKIHFQQSKQKNERNKKTYTKEI
jgi:hypothetical protein